MKIASTLAALLLCSAFSFSQGIYMRGFLVRNQGDTLKGWIRYGNWKNNPSKIEFKADSNAQSATAYTASEVSYFGIEGVDEYQRATVKLDLNSVDPVELFDAVSSQPDSVRMETLFLRVLTHTGSLHLYEFVDFKNHFFLQAGNGTIVELGYKLRVNRLDNTVTALNYYREQLHQYAGENQSASIFRKIENARYSSKSLLAIVSALNGSTGPVSNSSKTGGATNNHAQFLVSAGTLYSDLKMPGNSSITAANLHFKEVFVPWVSAGIDLPSPRNFNDWTLRFEAAYSENTFNGTKHTENTFSNPEYVTYNLKQQTISPSLSLLYNFRRTKKIRFYLGGGVAFNFSSYSGNQLTDIVYLSSTDGDTSRSSLVLKNVWQSILVRAGARVSKKFEISALAMFNGKIIEYNTFFGEIKNYGLKLSYFLN